MKSIVFSFKEKDSVESQYIELMDNNLLNAVELIQHLTGFGEKYIKNKIKDYLGASFASMILVQKVKVNQIPITVFYIKLENANRLIRCFESSKGLCREKYLTYLETIIEFQKKHECYDMLPNANNTTEKKNKSKARIYFNLIARGKKKYVKVSSDGKIRALSLIAVITGKPFVECKSYLDTLIQEEDDDFCFVKDRCDDGDGSIHCEVPFETVASFIRHVCKDFKIENAAEFIDIIEKHFGKETEENSDEDNGQSNGNVSDNIICFDEITPGSSVRVTEIDGVQYLSICDFIMVVCDKDENQADEVWHRLSDERKNEIQAFCMNCKFPGEGRLEQPVITFNGALMIMNWLPGEKAKERRRKTTQIIKHYLEMEQAIDCEKEISFAEIVQGRNSSVRTTPDGLLYAVDLVMVVTGKNREDAAKAIRDLSPQIFQPEKISCRQPEKDGHPSKLLTFQNALELVMVLPGRIAKETRVQFANVIRRYIEEDYSLISDTLESESTLIQSNSEKEISFAEIVQGRNSSVRITSDGLLYAVDLVMVVTGKNRDDAGKVLRRLTDNIFQSDKMSERPAYNGGHPTKLLTFQNSLELVMVLPGRIAKETRVQFANIIKRYMAGKTTQIPKHYLEMEQDIDCDNTMNIEKSVVEDSVVNESNCEKEISFAEIVQGRNSSVRITSDGLLYAVDLVMVVTGKNRDYSGWILRHIPEETFSSWKIHERKFPGKGNRHTKLLKFQDAIELVMVLPGKIAKDTRMQFANIIKRYLAGKTTQIPKHSLEMEQDIDCDNTMDIEKSVVEDSVVNESNCEKEISFAEIVQGRNSSVRITSDGLLYAVDLVMVVTGKNRDDAGMVLRRLPEDSFSPVKMTDRKMPGRGNAHTKLLTFSHAIELVMVLPGQVAKDTRVQFVNIIKRYMAGDPSLLDEIQANAKSNDPMNRMARESLDNDKEISDEQLVKRRKLNDSFNVSLEQSLSLIDTIVKEQPLLARTNLLLKEQNEFLKEHIVLKSNCLDLNEREHKIAESSFLRMTELRQKEAEVKENEQLKEMKMKQKEAEFKENEQLKEMKMKQKEAEFKENEQLKEMKMKQKEAEFKENERQKELEMKQKEIELKEKSLSLMERENSLLKLRYTLEFDSKNHGIESNVNVTTNITVHEEKTTVLKVFLQMESRFKLSKKDKDNLLIQAGRMTAKKYRLKHGFHPQKINVNDQEVCCYPQAEEEMIKECIQDAYRLAKCGERQQTLAATFKNV